MMPLTRRTKTPTSRLKLFAVPIRFTIAVRDGEMTHDPLHVRGRRSREFTEHVLHRTHSQNSSDDITLVSLAANSQESQDELVQLKAPAAIRVYNVEEIGAVRGDVEAVHESLNSDVLDYQKEDVPRNDNLSVDLVVACAYKLIYVISMYDGRKFS